jgi:hypothetical protein
MPVEAIIPLTGGLFGVTPGRASSPYLLSNIPKNQGDVNAHQLKPMETWG